MKPLNYPAIRAANRLLAPASIAHDVGAACDAEFDGGEWSGPASAESWERTAFQIVTKVAERFGMQEADLALQIAEYDGIQSDRTVEAICARSNRDKPGMLRRQAD